MCDVDGSFASCRSSLICVSFIYFLPLCVLLKQRSEYPGEYLQWNMNLYEWSALRARMRPFPELFRFDDQWLRACLPTDELRNEYLKKVHWRMTLIGTEGAGMFNHQVRFACASHCLVVPMYLDSVQQTRLTASYHYSRAFIYQFLTGCSFHNHNRVVYVLIIRSPGRVAHRQLAGATQRRQTVAHLRADRGTSGRTHKIAAHFAVIIHLILNSYYAQYSSRDQQKIVPFACRMRWRYPQLL
jgi:hypothetical protein